MSLQSNLLRFSVTPSTLWHMLDLLMIVVKNSSNTCFNKLCCATQAQHAFSAPHSCTSVAGAEPRVYTQVSDSQRMLAVLKEYLADYNAISKKPMQLVLFQFALEHISRICRIITSPGGHGTQACIFGQELPQVPVVSLLLLMIIWSA